MSTLCLRRLPYLSKHDKSTQIVVYLAIFSLYFRNFSYGFIKISDLIIILSLCYLGWNVNRIRVPKHIALSIVGFFILIPLSSYLSPVPVGTGALIELLRFLLCLSLFLTVFTSYTEGLISFKRVKNTLIFAGVLTSIIAVISVTFTRLFGMNAFSPLLYRGTRASPFFADPNYFASVLLLSFSLSLFDITGLFENSSLLREKRQDLLVSISLLAGIISSGSRAALAASIIILLIFSAHRIYQSSTLIHLSQKKILALSIILAFSSISFVIIVNALRTNSTILRSIQLRFNIWSAAVSVWVMRPLIGVGPNNIVEFSSMYPSSPIYGLARPAHNLFLDVLSSYGILGISVTLYLFINTALIAGRSYLERSSPILWVMGLALLGQLLMGIFLDMMTARWLWMLIGILLAEASKPST